MIDRLRVWLTQNSRAKRSDHRSRTLNTAAIVVYGHAKAGRLISQDTVRVIGQTSQMKRIINKYFFSNSL